MGTPPSLDQLPPAPLDTVNTRGPYFQASGVTFEESATDMLIVRPDGSTLAGGFPYTVRLINGSNNQVRSGQTSATGVYRMGGLTLGLYALADLVRGVRTRAIDRGPWIALAAAVVAMFLNPYGMRGVVFLWELRTRLEFKGMSDVCAVARSVASSGR